MTDSAPITIKFDGKDVEFASLPKDLQHMVTVLSDWTEDYQVASLEATKLDFAIEGIKNQIIDKLQIRKDKGSSPMELDEDTFISGS